jgi:hemolysin activation/secretion protein
VTFTGRIAGQLALNPLTSDMGFTIGSDNGLRGLPGQLVSGDSGYLGSLELAYTLWSKAQQSLQLAPFIGAGGVQSYRDSLSFSDTAGAGGVLLRWLQTERWSMELGWVSPFLTENQPLWNDWLLSKGLYSQLKLRF